MSRNKTSPRRQHPDIEVRAAATKLFAAAFEVFPSLAQKYLGGFAFALEDVPSRIPKRGFIPLDAWLDTFDRVLADIGPNVLFQIGQRVVNNPHFTEDAKTLEDALRQVDIAYHKSHRKGGLMMYESSGRRMLEGIGHYQVTGERANKAFVITSDTPYPCPLEQGIVSSIAALYEPRALVVHQGTDECRMKGAHACSYLVSW